MNNGNHIFAVKRTETGLGLFALQNIKAKTKLLEYEGNIISNEEADKKGGKYLFNLSDKLTLDGSQRSNKARYINHSCRPNSEALIFGKRIWILSKKAIKAEEEITINYGKEYFDEHIKPKGCKCEKCVGERKR